MSVPRKSTRFFILWNHTATKNIDRKFFVEPVCEWLNQANAIVSVIGKLNPQQQNEAMRHQQSLASIATGNL